MDTTSQDVDSTTDSALPTADAITKQLKAASAKCKRKRRELVQDTWSTNVDYRRGKPFDAESDDDRVYVNVDATMTRRKAAQLASQMPEVRLKPKHPQTAPLTAGFAKRLNDEARKACVGDAIYESVVDCINASGFAMTLVGYEARTESVVVPIGDPVTLGPDQQEVIAQAKTMEPDLAIELFNHYGIPAETVDRKVSSRFYVTRKSPSDAIWPLEFERSNFDYAPWLGHSARMNAAEAKLTLRLTPEDFEAIKGSTSNRSADNLRDDRAAESDEADVIEYDEIFYWRAQYDANEKRYDAIWQLVFVEGLDRPVIHEPWKGQKFLDGVGYVGATKLPLRVLTLDYFSDDAIPPSDSSIARPQVNEKIRSRTQMIQQRERSLPMRWHNTNLLDPATAVNLQRGVWQASVAVKGDGARVMGEVARANYPTEDFTFDQIINHDIQESWQIDSNQLGQFARGRRTAAEANVVQQNFATQTGFQRARVAAYFVGIMEVLAGLLVLHGEGLQAPAPDPNNPQAPPMDLAQMAGAFEYSILPDATVLLDANQEADRLMDFLDMVGKSGFVNPKPIIERIARLKGIDPQEVMMDPQEKKDDPPSISYRFSGEDLTNPVALAILLKANQAPTPQELGAALKLLQAAGAVVMPSPLMAPAETAPPRKELPPADSRPEWQTMPSITKRSDD